jgi:hypothetical protein
VGCDNSDGGIPWILFITQIVVAAIGVVIAANLYAPAERPPPLNVGCSSGPSSGLARGSEQMLPA